MLRKLVKYLFTFALVFVVAMATTITFLSPKDYGNNDAGLGATGAGYSAVVSKMLTYFQTLKEFEVSAQVQTTLSSESENEEENSNAISNVSYDQEQSCALELNIKADISSLTAPKVEAYICYNNGTKIEATIIFDGTDLYLTINEKSFVVYHETLESTIYLMMGLISNGGLDAESLIDSFDVGAIMGALNSMKETANEATGNVTSTLTLPQMASVDIVTDEDYNLKSLRIYNLEIIDLPLEATINIEKQESVEINAPENISEFFDISGLITSAKNTFNLTTFTISPTISLKTDSFCETLSANIINNSASGLKEINAECGGVSLGLASFGGEYYAGLNNIKVKTKAQNISDLIERFTDKTISSEKLLNKAKTFASDYIEDNSENINSLKTTITDYLKDIDILEVINSLIYFDASENEINLIIDLSKISKFNIDAQLELRLNLNGEIISGVGFKATYNQTTTLEANILISGEEVGATDLSSDKYLDIDALIEKLESLKDLRSGSLSANAVVAGLDKNYDVNFKLVADSINKNASLKLNAQGSINQDLLLVYKNESIFAQTGDVKIKLNQADIFELLGQSGIDYTALLDVYSAKIDEVLQQYKTKAENITIPEIDATALVLSALSNKEQTLDILNKAYILLNNIETSSTGVSIKIDKTIFGLEKDIILNIYFDSNILNIGISGLNVGGLDISANITLNTADQTIQELNDEEFLDVFGVLKKIESLKDARSGEITINAVVKDGADVWQTLDADLLLDYTNKYASVVANLGGNLDYNFSFILDNTLVYATLNDIGIKLDYEKLIGVLAEFGIDVNSELAKICSPEILEEYLNSAKERIKEQTKQIDAKEMLLKLLFAVKNISVNSTEIRIELDGEKLGAKENIIAIIEFKDGIACAVSLENIEVIGKTISARIGFSAKEIEKQQINAGKYLDVLKLKERIETLASANSGSLSAQATIEENGSISLLAGVNAKFNINETFAWAKAFVAGKINKNIELTLDGENVFVAFNNVKVALNINKFKALLTSFGIDVNNTISETTNNIKETTTGLDYLGVKEKIKTILAQLGQEDYIITTALATLETKTINDIISSVVYLRAQSNQIKLELDGALLGQERNITITVWLLNKTYTSISVKNLKIGENKFITFALSAEATEVLKQTPQEDQYLDLISVYENTVSLKDARNGEINLNVVVMDGADVWQTVDANIKLDVNDLANIYANVVASLTGEYEYNGNVVINGNDVYVQIGNIAVKLNIENLLEILAGYGIDVRAIVSEYINEFNIADKKEEIMSSASEIDISSMLPIILDSVKSYRVNANEISVVIDGSLLNQEEDILIAIYLTDNTINRIKVENVNVLGKTIFADIEFAEKDIVKEIPNVGNYLDLISAYENTLALQDIRNGEININAVVMEGENVWQTADVNIKADYNETYANIVANLVGTYEYNGNVVINGSDIYVQLGNIAVKINVENAIEVLASCGIDVRAIINDYVSAIDVESASAEIESKLAEADISAMLPAILASVKSYAVNANEISVTIDGSVLNQTGDISLTIYLEDNTINRIKVENINISGKTIFADIAFAEKDIVKEIPNEVNYLDINAVYENTLALKDARSGEININATILENDAVWQTIDANIVLDVNDLFNLYANIVASLEGQYNYSGNIMLSGFDLYAQIGDFAGKVNLFSLLGILEENGVNTGALLEQIAEILNPSALEQKMQEMFAGVDVATLSQQLLPCIKSVCINGGEIRLVIDGVVVNLVGNITISIGVEDNTINNIKVENLTLEGKTIFADVHFEAKDVERANGDNAEYLDICELYNNTIALKDARNGEININAVVMEGVDVWQTVDANIKLDVNDLADIYANIVASLAGEYEYNGSVVLNGSDIYVQLGNIAVKVDIENLIAILAGYGIDVRAIASEYIAELNIEDKKAELLESADTIEIKELVQKYIGYIKSYGISASEIRIVIDGTAIEQAGDITITICLTDNTVNRITLENLTLEGKTIFADIAFAEKDIVKEIPNENEYLDLVAIYESTLALKDVRNGEININAVVMDGADVWQTVDANIKLDVCDLEDIYANIVASLAGEYEYNGSVVLNGNDVYAKLADIAVKLNIERVFEILADYGIDAKALVSGYIAEFNIESKKEELMSVAGEIDIKAMALDYMQYIKSLTISASEIKVVLDAQAFESEGQASVTIKLNNDAICGLKLENINISGKTIFADIEFAEKDIERETPNENEYLNITDVYDENIGLKDARSGQASVSIVAEDNGVVCESISVSAVIDYLNNYYEISGTISGSYNYNLFAVYDDGTAYVKFKGAQIKANISDALEFLDKIGINTDDLFNSDEDFNLDDLFDSLESYNISTALLREIRGKLENIDLSAKEKLLKNIYVSQNTICAIIDGSILGQEEGITLTITLENNKAKEVKLENIIIDGKKVKIVITLESTDQIEKTEINQSEYVDLVAVANNIYNLKDLTNLNLGFDAVLSEGASEKYGLYGSLKLKTNETDYSSIEERIVNFVNSSYLSLNATLGGETELDADITLYNETLYIHLNETYIKITRQDAYELVGIPISSKADADAFILDKLASHDIMGKINELLNSTSESELDVCDLLDKLDKITITSSSTQIKVIIDGSLVDQNKDLTVILNISNNKVVGASVTNLKIDDNTYIRFNITLDAETEIEPEPCQNQDNYFDLTTGYNNILDTLSLPAAQVSTSVGIYDTARTNLNEKTITKANGYSEIANIAMQKISNSANKTLDLHGTVNLTGILNDANLEAYYKNNVLYITYRSNKGEQALSFKINKSNIRNTALEICGLFMDDEDVDKIGDSLNSAEDFMEGAGLDTLVDLTDLQLINLISGLTSGGAEETTSEAKTYTLSEIVDLLNGITMNKNGLSIIIPASMINAETDLKVVADYDATKITRLAVVGLDANLFADSIDLSMIGLDLTNKFIDLNLNIVQSCASVASPSGTYMDLNGIDTLVKGASKAFKENKSFTLSGTISMKLLNMNVSWLTDTDVDVVIKINYTEADGLELYIELNGIPTTTLVFNGYSTLRAWSSKNTKIYYKNDRVYITRTNTYKPLIGSQKTSTIKYSMTPDWCFEHIDTVLGYALDFNSTIQKKITESLNSTDENAPACVIENILKSFSCSTSGTTGTYNLTVSGAALAQDTMIGDMGLTIKMNTSTLKINSIGINMAFVSVLDLTGTLNLTTYTNKQSISFSTSGYTFKG